MDEEAITKLKNKMKVNVKNLLIQNAKFRTISDLFPGAAITNLEDLFSLNLNHQRWVWLNQNFVKYMIFGDKKKVHESF